MHTAHATHHMRNHCDANAIALQVASNALYGASALAREMHVQVLYIYKPIVHIAQESPPMRVENMGVTTQSCNFP